MLKSTEQQSIYRYLPCKNENFSYHQKYLLRKHEWLVHALELTDDKELITSRVAARINGYVGGYGTEVIDIFIDV